MMMMMMMMIPSMIIIAQSEKNKIYMLVWLKMRTRHHLQDSVEMCGEIVRDWTAEDDQMRE